MLLPPAMKTGKLTIVTGAMAREVLSNAEGKATGISYVDTTTGEERTVQGRIVRVEGHTDDVPTGGGQFPTNWELSRHKRAEVASILGAACRGHDILYSTRILKKTGLRLRDE